MSKYNHVKTYNNNIIIVKCEFVYHQVQIIRKKEHSYTHCLKILTMQCLNIFTLVLNYK